MPRWLAILAAIPPLLLLALLALSADDLPGLILAKLTEGGLWTGLAAFLVMAVVLAFFRKPDGQSRASAKVK
jgi:membrane protein implicated in regulation of membrane protease activity